MSIVPGLKSTMAKAPGKSLPDARPLSDKKNCLARFARDERGGVSIFVLVLFILMLVVGGMSVDYQRHELARADLQDALDRGSLAAANQFQVYTETDPDNEVDDQAEAIILSYMASRNYRGDAFDLDVTVTPNAGGRQVAASANMSLDTIFLQMIGIDRMDVNAQSIATQSLGKIEIMLVLDITGSMTWDSQSGLSKIEDLKIAAKQFLDTVLETPTTQTLISIVPFSQNVNLPTSVANLYNMNRHHDYANCIDYHEFDFTTRSLPVTPLTPYKQAQHFRSNVGSGRFGCPKENNAATLFSNDLDELKGAIDSISPETWTAMYMGMKWGTGLLDPSSSPIVNSMVSSGDLPANFSNWPHAWDDMSARKIIVLMSDGGNTRLNEIHDVEYANHTPEWWNDNDPGSARYSVINNESDGIGDAKLAQICTAAKTGSNVVVYTIGFEVDDYASAQAALSNCASSPSTYYLVEGVEISTAFQNIAEEIANLKLIN